MHYYFVVLHELLVRKKPKKINLVQSILVKKNQSFQNDRLFHERTFNLLYITQSYYPAAQKTSLIRRASDEDQPFSNLFIWDINAQTKSALFSNEIAATEKIQRILFEKEYDDTNQSLLFNSDTHLFNQGTIPYRNLKNKLLIETYHFESEKYHLWLSNKQGNDLSKIATIGINTQWHLDVGNSTIRIIQHLKTDVNIQEIAW